MENSNLNLAHYHGRRAENHFKHFRFDKALENYQMAANYIEEAMKTVTSPNIMVSLKLQLQEHTRQINAVNLRKICLDKYIRELARQKQADLLAKKRSPCISTGTPELEGSESSPKRSSDGSAVETSMSSILELDMQESSIMALAPLELPPLLDFESFRFNRTDANDL